MLRERWGCSGTTKRETPREGASRSSALNDGDENYDEFRPLNGGDRRGEVAAGRPRGKSRERIRRTLRNSGGAVAVFCTCLTVKGLVDWLRWSPFRVESGDDKARSFRVSSATYNEFVNWTQSLYYEYSGSVPAVDWSWHPRNRRDRFPSVRERVEYYMGKWYDSSDVNLYGDEYLRKTWELQLTTRRFGISASFVVDLFGFDIESLLRCYREEETGLFEYCRDYVDFAILHREMSAGAIQHMGDGLPQSSPNKGKLGGVYPVWNKVRNYCDVPPDRLGQHYSDGDINRDCRGDDSRIDAILWPLNRHRHFKAATEVTKRDIPWTQKAPRAIWRGGTHCINSSRGRQRWALVSNNINSSLIDAKFADIERTEEGFPNEYLAPFVKKRGQLRYRYLICIEGNDVSSGLKWMLFSNSLVMMPPTTFESWAMEGLLEPYVHYLPLKSDMSDIEAQIRWAESHPVEAQRIAQRSTLFIYDLLFHPDAMEDERAVLRGIVERYEENFGYFIEVREKHMLGHVGWDRHPQRREDRFPTVEERVRYCMGHWHDAAVDMGRKEGKGKQQLPPALSGLDNIPRLDADFVASGKALSKCAAAAAAKSANGSSSAFSLLARYCDEALPFFDERLVYDLLEFRPPKKNPSFKLAPEKDGMNDFEKKWFNRVLVDDSIKVLRFGEVRVPSLEETMDVPVFAGMRRASVASRWAGKSGGFQGRRKAKKKVNSHNPNGSGDGSLTILWTFGSFLGGYDLVRSGLIEQLDMPFQSKEPRAVWRGGFGTEGFPDKDCAEFNNRQMLVGKLTENIDARFVVPNEVLRRNKKQGEGAVPKEMVGAEPKGKEDQVKQLKHMLTFRYIIATEDNYRVNAELKWMLLSQSVVFMPQKRRFASWFMEDMLEPYVHFIPIQVDYSDVEKQITWCENHPFDVERVSERATLYVHDMLFHQRAAKDDADVRLGIMERYAEQFGRWMGSL